jgi:hypothetical protein
MIVVEDPAVVAWMERRLGVTFSHPHIVRGFMTDDGKLLCAVLFNNYSGSNIDISVASRRITRGVLRYVARYVFAQLGCRRLTTITKKRNKHAQRMAARCGFKFESVARHFFPDDDGVVFRMLRDECRWM